MPGFIGSNLRLARLFHAYSLADLGDRVKVSKQFLSRLETGAESIPSDLETALCDALLVIPEFFYNVDPHPIADEQCHFRKQLTTKATLRQIGRARGEMLKRLIAVLDDHLELPQYGIEEADPDTSESIECGAEQFRARFNLGMGPLQNVTRVAENAGVVVLKLQGMASEIDAVSFATKRPVIALNAEGKSACRERFGVAHELGHFALHIGVLTGDRLTESQANRFASSFLMPRSTFSTECRMAVRGSRLSWAGLSELKKRWGVSKSAIIYRGRQLEIFSEEQARTGYIHLKRGGEAIEEHEDNDMPHEQPEVVVEGLKVMNEHFGIPHVAVAREMRVQHTLLRGLLSESTPPSSGNVISLFERTAAR